MLIKSNSRLFLSITVVTALWAPANLMIKVLMAGCSNAAAGVLRWGGIAVVMWLFLCIPKFRKMEHIEMPQIGDGIRALLVGLLCVGPSHALLYYALTMTSSVESTVLNTTTPIFSSLLAIIFLKEKLGIRRWGAIGLGCIGAYVIAVGFDGITMGNGTQLGNLIYLCGIFLECAGMVFATKVVLKSSGIGTVSWMAVGNALASILLIYIFPQHLSFHISQISWPMVGALAYLVIVAGVICFAAWYHIAKKAPLSFMVVCMGVEPIVAALLGWFILKEPITTRVYAGTVFVLASLFVAATEKQLTKPSHKSISHSDAEENERRRQDEDQVGVNLAGVP